VINTLWRSYNYGDSWQELPNARDYCGEGGASYIGFHPTVSRTLFLGYEAVFACRSDDEGLTWDNPGYWDVPIIDPSVTSTWYAAYIPGVWRSTGGDWAEFQ
jgi:hypothetical protein